jgi:hypothetical protein
MKPYIQYIQFMQRPRPRRDWRRAVVTICLLALAAAISITAIIVAYVILS